VENLIETDTIDNENVTQGALLKQEAATPTEDIVRVGWNRHAIRKLVV